MPEWRAFVPSAGAASWGDAAGGRTVLSCGCVWERARVVRLASPGAAAAESVEVGWWPCPTHAEGWAALDFLGESSVLRSTFGTATFPLDVRGLSALCREWCAWAAQRTFEVDSIDFKVRHDFVSADGSLLQGPHRA